MELGGAFSAGAPAFAGAGGAGVSSGSALGGSLSVGEEVGSEVEVDPELPAGADAGNSTLKGERTDASVSFTLEPAASPSTTPKPRNTRTSNAETRAGGSLRPARAGVGAGASGAGTAGLRGAAL